MVVVEGNGRVTSSDQRIDCPGTCEAEYPNHGTVDLNAVPVSTADSFNGWS